MNIGKYSILMVVLLGTVIYCNSFDVPFHFDDRYNLIENHTIRQLDLGSIWSTSHARFIGYLTFAVNYRLGGLHIFGYHLVNLLIHLACSLLVMWLASLLSSSPPVGGMSRDRNGAWLALAASLMFVCHPVQTQAVTYIIQRFTSLAAFFYLASVCCYLKARLAWTRGINGIVPIAFMGLAGLSCAMAFLTKESSYSLPLMLIACELFFVRRNGRIDRRWSALMIAALVVAAGVVLLGIKMPTRETDDIGRWQYFITQWRVMVTYLRLLVLPVGQNLDYDFPLSRSVLELPTLASGALLATLVALAASLFKRARMISFSIVWFFIALSVESTIIPIRDVIFEHRLYLPLVGFAIALSNLIFLFGKRVSMKAAMAGLIAILTAFSISTVIRNQYWRHPLLLWHDTVTKSPNKARPYVNRAKAYIEAGQPDLAIADFRQALSIQPMDPVAYYDLGGIFTERRQYPLAIQCYCNAIIIKPGYQRAYVNLANVFLTTGQLDSAERYALLALRLNPGLSLAYYNLGQVAMARQRYRQGIVYFSRTIDIEPTYRWAYLKRGQCYFLVTGEYDHALHDLCTAIDLDEQEASAHYWRGRVLLAMRDTIAALGDFTAALKLDHDDPEALYHRGLLYLLNRQGSKAMADFRQLASLAMQDSAATCSAKELRLLMRQAEQVNAAQKR